MYIFIYIFYILNFIYILQIWKIQIFFFHIIILIISYIFWIIYVFILVNIFYPKYFSRIILFIINMFLFVMHIIYIYYIIHIIYKLSVYCSIDIIWKLILYDEFYLEKTKKEKDDCIIRNSTIELIWKRKIWILRKKNIEHYSSHVNIRRKFNFMKTI